MNEVESAIIEEEAIIRGLITATSQPRALLLLASRRRRKWIRGMRAQLNPSLIVPIVPEQHSPAPIVALLKELGAPPMCRLISEDSKIDGTTLHLDVALAQTVGSGMITLVSCIPGSLAYYEGEGPGERFILRRSQPIH